MDIACGQAELVYWEYSRVYTVNTPAINEIIYNLEHIFRSWIYWTISSPPPPAHRSPGAGWWAGCGGQAGSPAWPARRRWPAAAWPPAGRSAPCSSRRWTECGPPRAVPHIWSQGGTTGARDAGEQNRAGIFNIKIINQPSNQDYFCNRYNPNSK